MWLLLCKAPHLIAGVLCLNCCIKMNTQSAALLWQYNSFLSYAALYPFVAPALVQLKQHILSRFMLNG